MDPQSLDALVNHGMLLYYKRDYEAAEEVSRRAIAKQPGDQSALLLLARVLEAQGRYEEALETANRAAQLVGNVWRQRPGRPDSVAGTGWRCRRSAGRREPCWKAGRDG